MDDQQIVGLVGQGGVAGALIFVIYKIGTALVEAIKGLRTSVDEHTKSDLAAQGEVREELVALQTRIDVIADITPIRGIPKQRAATQPGDRTGYYGPRKPPREED